MKWSYCTVLFNCGACPDHAKWNSKQSAETAAVLSLQFLVSWVAVLDRCG